MGNANNYPIDALPPLLRDAVRDVQQHTQAPEALIAASALASTAVACQHLANVLLPSIEKICPISLAILTIADSGERKSTVDEYFTKTIREFQHECEKHYQAELRVQQAQEVAWRAEKKVIEKSIEKLFKAGQEIEEAKRKLVDMELTKPEKPKRVKILYSDTTPSALQYGLAENSRSVALWSSEGGSILGGHGATNLPLLNSLFSGEAIEIDRRSSESFTIEGARLTINIMSQPHAVKQFFTRNNGAPRESGHLARMLISAPASTQGTRLITSFSPARDMKALNALRQWQMRALQEGSHFESPSHLLIFSQEASIVWIEYFNKIEESLNPGGALASIRDFGSKLAEITARLAAIFQLTEEHSSLEIGKENMERAIKISTWHANESKRIFEECLDIETNKNKQLLLKYLSKKHAENNWWVTKTDILQNGPKPIRKAMILDPIIMQMANNYELFIMPHGKTIQISINSNSEVNSVYAKGIFDQRQIAHVTHDNPSLFLTPYRESTFGENSGYRK